MTDLEREMLAVLKNAERAIRTYTASARKECGLDAIRAVIAKAEG